MTDPAYHPGQTIDFVHNSQRKWINGCSVVWLQNQPRALFFFIHARWGIDAGKMNEPQRCAPSAQAPWLMGCLQSVSRKKANNVPLLGCSGWSTWSPGPPIGSVEHGWSMGARCIIGKAIADVRNAVKWCWRADLRKRDTTESFVSIRCRNRFLMKSRRRVMNTVGGLENGLLNKLDTGHLELGQTTPAANAQGFWPRPLHLRFISL